MKRALVTGITGQDGSYLAEFLLSKGYEVWGLLRRTSLDPTQRLEEISRHPNFHLVHGNLRDTSSLERAVEQSRPDEIYNLAAQSHVGLSFELPEETLEVTYYGVGRLLHAAHKFAPEVRVYQASTSEMFGKTPPPQNEFSPFAPVSPYAEAKLKAYQDFVLGYRDRHGMFASSGILFNHESPRRGKNFVTRKITHSLARIKTGLQEKFSLGNLEAKRDWGFAGDYVEAMWRIVQHNKPDDFVIATGESHSVRDFVEMAGKALDMPIHFEGEGLNEVGLDPKGRVVLTIDEKFYRPAEVHYLTGDASKAKRELNWEPKVTLEELIRMMAEADLKEAERHL